MQLDIQGHHVQLSDALREYIEKKCRRIEQRNPDLDLLRVILTADGGKFRAEMQTHVPRRDRVIAQAESDDMYAAIDQAVRSLDEQLRRIRDKINKSRHS
ncbi:MAG: ribosome-associated translation inhibitor RaiA [Gammaproteobacteria bacterium AqS3]|nr:ribosome-associated translation inhibitor RaiA [Gammaproteobacteria bacterium AqS3]